MARPQLDLNGTAPAPTGSNPATNTGEWAPSYLVAIRTLAVDDGGAGLGSNASTPRTPTCAAVPWNALLDCVQTELIEWYRARCELMAEGVFATPQLKQLSGQQIQQRVDASESARKLRAAILHTRRLTPERLEAAESSSRRRSPDRPMQRGPLLFHPTPQ